MPGQKKLRYAMYFLFTILVYWQSLYFFPDLGQSVWIIGVSRSYSALALGIAFPFLVCALSFALLNKDIYRIRPLKLGLSILVATAIFSLSRHILSICQYRLWIALPDTQTAFNEAIIWAVNSVSFAFIVGLCAFLFYALLRFSAKEPIPKSFPCKKGVMAPLLLIAAVLMLLENICTPPGSLIFGEFSSDIGFRWMRQISFLLNAVAIAAIFMVAFFAEIRMRLSAIETL